MASIDLGPITIGTLFAFLGGSSTAIRKVAGSQQATWYGLGLVLMAGLAREYDQESLLYEPWYLLIPVAASVLLSLVLYVSVWRILRFHWWLPFLRCIWFCSPMALLYAIPVERMGDAYWAAGANLSLLGIVSTWRVLLAIRIVSVLQGISFWRGLGLVLWPVDTIALVGLVLAWVSADLRVMEFMGGVQHSPVEDLIRDVQIRVIIVVFWTCPVAAILYLCTGYPPDEPRTMMAGPDARVDRSVWAFFIAFGGLLAWGCTVAQPEQLRRYHAEQLIKRGDFTGFAQSVRLSSQLEFPPHWNPPPARLHPRHKQFIPVLRALSRTPETPRWLEIIYETKLLRHAFSGINRRLFWEECSPEEIEALIEIMDHSANLRDALDGDRDRTVIAAFIGAEIRNYNGQSPPPELLLRLLKHARDNPHGPKIEDLERQLKELLVPPPAAHAKKAP